MTSTTGAALTLDKVTKRFGGVVAVNDVSFSVAPGSIHGLIGPNGAGKSTLVSLISGYQRADGGTIRLDDVAITGVSPLRIALRGLARTFQAATPLQGMTVRENVEVGLHTTYTAGLARTLLRGPGVRREDRECRAATVELLARYGLTESADRLAADLPFGQLRFLEIARAIAREPRILLLDEPAAGLDQTETSALADLLRHVNGEGTTVLVIDHDVPFMFSLCHDVTVVNFGSVIASGVAAEVARDPVVRDAYLGSGSAGEETE